MPASGQPGSALLGRNVSRGKASPHGGFVEVPLGGRDGVPRATSDRVASTAGEPKTPVMVVPEVKAGMAKGIRVIRGHQDPAFTGDLTELRDVGGDERAFSRQCLDRGDAVRFVPGRQADNAGITEEGALRLASDATGKPHRVVKSECGRQCPQRIPFPAVAGDHEGRPCGRRHASPCVEEGVDALLVAVEPADVEDVRAHRIPALGHREVPRIQTLRDDRDGGPGRFPTECFGAVVGQRNQVPVGREQRRGKPVERQPVLARHLVGKEELGRPDDRCPRPPRGERRTNGCGEILNHEVMVHEPCHERLEGNEAQDVEREWSRTEAQVAEPAVRDRFGMGNGTRVRPGDDRDLPSPGGGEGTVDLAGAPCLPATPRVAEVVEIEVQDAHPGSVAPDARDDERTGMMVCTMDQRDWS